MHKLVCLNEEHSLIQYLLSFVYDLQYFLEPKTEMKTLHRRKLPSNVID